MRQSERERITALARGSRLASGVLNQIGLELARRFPVLEQSVRVPIEEDERVDQAALERGAHVRVEGNRAVIEDARQVGAVHVRKGKSRALGGRRDALRRVRRDLGQRAVDVHVAERDDPAVAVRDQALDVGRKPLHVFGEESG